MMQLESTLTCRSCGHQSVETMPTDACQFFYDCKGCGTRLKPPRWRLLRVLFLWLGPVPTGPEQSTGCLGLLRFEVRKPKPAP
jgi:hypothetical protein